MVLTNLKNLTQNQDALGSDDFKGLDVYDTDDEKVVALKNILVDEAGRFRYLVVDTGFWFCKQVIATSRSFPYRLCTASML